MSQSIQKSALESQVLDLFEKVGSTLGLRAIDIDCRVSHRSLVRIFIERQLGTGHTATIEDCAETSRVFGAALEATELFPGPYDLEVSSPGVERRLRLESDFTSEVGKELRLKLTESVEGKGANLTGVLESIEGGLLTVLQDKTLRKIPLEKVKQASLVWRGPEKGAPGQKGPARK